MLSKDRHTKAKNKTAICFLAHYW